MDPRYIIIRSSKSIKGPEGEPIRLKEQKSKTLLRKKRRKKNKVARLSRKKNR